MSASFRILVTEPIRSEATELLRRHGSVTIGTRGEWDDEEKLTSGLKDYDAVLTMLSNPVTKKVLEANKHLKIVANYAVGYNNIDVATAHQLGIRVANTPDVLSEATADIALLLLLSTARRGHAAEKDLYEGNFDGWHPEGFLGYELHGKQALIIGMGRIGKAIARRLNGFGINVKYHNRTQKDSKTETELGVTWAADLDSTLPQTDFLLLSCPLTADTHHIINRDRLRQLPNHALVINTGRGPLIDEEALAESLHNREIGGAGLDVFEREPIIHPKLLTAPNTTLLPHIGSATYETRNKMGLLASEAIISTLLGKPENQIPNLIRKN